MTHAEYKEGLARLQRENPGEALLPALCGGYTRINIVYMRAAINRLNSGVKKEVVVTTSLRKGAEVVFTATFKQEAPVADVLKSLYTQQQVLRAEKSKLSNEFHNCKTEEDRKELSKKILAKDELIRANEGKIEHYKLHQALPSESEEDEFYLPDDAIALMKKANSIAAQISQTKRKLDELGSLADRDPGRSEILKYEQKLARLKLYKGFADEKIKASSV